MKNIINKTTVAAALFIAAITGSNFANANELVYKRSLNHKIGITPEANAIGYNYSVIDAAGNTVLTGKISDAKTFFLFTQKLKPGNYEFRVGNSTVQNFTVK